MRSFRCRNLREVACQNVSRHRNCKQTHHVFHFNPRPSVVLLIAIFSISVTALLKLLQYVSTHKVPWIDTVASGRTKPFSFVNEDNSSGPCMEWTFRFPSLALAPAALLLWFLLDYIYAPKHHPKEPPVVPQSVPFIGHVIGLLRHGTRYES